VSVIRAFTYFSHLANLAEDRHHIRRRAVHERAGDTQEGSIEVALRACAGPASRRKTVAADAGHSFVAPVLTAHPTEVQRKSILDAERDIAQLLTERDDIRVRAAARRQRQGRAHPARAGRQRAQLRARVMQLWQTRLLRFTKLTVADEIENALSYYESTFPARNSQALRRTWKHELLGHRVASFLRMGQWIGGDRDGNPNVMRRHLAYALRRQADVALRHYLTEVHYLGGELSLSAMLVDVSADMQALAERSPDTNAHRQDEPYRRALTGIYARLAATLKALTGGDAARHAVHPRNPTPAPRSLAGRSAGDRSLAADAPRRSAGRPAPAPADPRGRGVRLSPGHGRPAPKLRPARSGGGRTAGHARIEPDYASLDETPSAMLLLRKLLNDARPLRVMGATYGPHPRRTGHL
jgi:phosphoenolpyruvate carboxylase